MSFRVGLALCLGVWCASAAFSVAHGQRKVLRASPRTSAIEIDGRIDEPAWQTTEANIDFVERRPNTGAVPAVQNEVRVLFDRDALYVAVRLGEPKAVTPRALAMQRDSFDVFLDDAVTVKLDVRRDRRTTVGFTVNPAGTQLDYIALENGRSFRTEYDAVWECQTQVEECFWTAEFKLPVAALGLAPEDGTRVLGFNITRDYNHGAATHDWSLIGLEFSPADAAQYGDLEGVRDMGGGRPLVLTPYVLGGYLRDETRPDEGPLRGKAGGNVALRLGEDMWGELTLLTDFAEVDVDDAIINLSRFPITLPEKRPFFLSGLDVFEFGRPGEAQLFFSRRIGLGEDIYGGLKLYGRTGDVDVGLLEVTTEAGDVVTDVREASQRPPPPAAPASAWSVARARYNLGNHGHVGALFASRHTLSDPDPDLNPARSHYSGGVDLRLRTPDTRWEARAFGAFTLTPNDGRNAEVSAQKTGESASVELFHRGVRFQPSTSVLYVSDQFDPEVGFVRRRNVVQSDVVLPWLQPVSRFGLERITSQLSGTLLRAAVDGSPLGYETTLLEEVRFRNQWIVTMSGSLIEDRVTEAFDLAGRVTVDAGTYRNEQASVRVASPEVRNPSAAVGYTAGSFYGGFRHTLEPSLTISATRHFRLVAATVLDHLDFPGQAPFVTTATNLRATIAATPRLILSLVGQYGSVQERWNAQARLRYRYLPGSDLIAVYQELLSGRTLRNANTTLRSFILKISHRFDALL